MWSGADWIHRLMGYGMYKKMFTRKFLMKWWSRALRRRVLYKALDGEDRAYMYLAMRVFDEIRSADVGMIIVKILANIKDALKSPFVKRMETYGEEKARRICGWAVGWGHDGAVGWAHDPGFMRYLTFLDFNKSPGGGV